MSLSTVKTKKLMQKYFTRYKKVAYYSSCFRKLVDSPINLKNSSTYSFSSKIKICLKNVNQFGIGLDNS